MALVLGGAETTAERLAYLLRELRDEGVVPEEYEEEVDEALTKWDLLQEEEE